VGKWRGRLWGRGVVIGCEKKESLLCGSEVRRGKRQVENKDEGTVVRSEGSCRKRLAASLSSRPVQKREDLVGE